MLFIQWRDRVNNLETFYVKYAPTLKCYSLQGSVK